MKMSEDEMDAYILALGSNIGKIGFDNHEREIMREVMDIDTFDSSEGQTVKRYMREVAARTVAYVVLQMVKDNRISIQFLSFNGSNGINVRIKSVERSD